MEQLIQNEKFFEYSRYNSDEDIVVNFSKNIINNVRPLFELIFNEKYSTLNRVLSNNKIETRGENEVYRYEIMLNEIKIPKSVKPKIRDLEKHGLTGKSLRYKLDLLNNLWDQLAEKVNNIGNRFIDFSSNTVVKLIRIFLSYLNAVVDSVGLIPGLEFIKAFQEVKDYMEAGMQSAETLKDKI